MERYTLCRCLILKVWSTDQQHQQYLGACKNIRILGFIPDFLNQKLYFNKIPLWIACINESLKTSTARSQRSLHYHIDLGNLNQNSYICACKYECVCVCESWYICSKLCIKNAKWQEELTFFRNKMENLLYWIKTILGFSQSSRSTKT